MNPRHGEVWLVDMGIAAKTRPAIVLIADNLNAPRTLVIHIPITRQNRGSDLEVALDHLPFLDPESVANAQAIGSLPAVRFEKRLGILPDDDLKKVKAALSKRFEEVLHPRRIRQARWTWPLKSPGRCRIRRPEPFFDRARHGNRRRSENPLLHLERISPIRETAPSAPRPAAEMPPWTGWQNRR
jgi:mRNA interferase MazF